MNEPRTQVTFLPAHITVEGSPGDTILDAALAQGFDLPHECGGNCACTTCHVIIQAGAENLSPMEEVEFDRVRTAEDWRPESRLGCQALLRGGAVIVLVPEVW